jgi:DNA polymerase III epsilon subunit-like protein
MDGKPVLWVAHNGRSFDVPFLFFEFRRCKVEMPGDWLFVDTLPIARQLVDSEGMLSFQVYHFLVWTYCSEELPFHNKVMRCSDLS